MIAPRFTFLREPAVWLGCIGAVVTLLVAFGLKLSGEQISAISMLAGMLVPIIIALITRSQVTPNETADNLIELAVKAAPDTTIAEVKEQLQAKVEAADSAAPIV